MTDAHEARIRAEMQEIASRAYERLFKAYGEIYRSERETGAPDTVVGGACVGALLHVAAAAAVGIGMDDGAFHLAADESYEAALRRAPRWG